MSNQTTIINQNIQSRIFTIRGLQVMVDKDLADLYQVETRVLKQAVKRNKNRFPEDFMFVLDNDEIDLLVSQSVIPSKKQLSGAKPFVFTEQGVATLSSVLTSDRAIEINIHIMRAFVQMRKFITNNALVFQEMAEMKQVLKQHDGKLEKVFEAIEAKAIKPEQGIFFDGQVFDAYVFVADLIKSAKKSIVLIDNYKVNSEGREGVLGYVDESTLMLLTKRKAGCTATIYTHTFSQKLQADLQKHNEQYASIEIKTFKKSHDRFLILDNNSVYHFGASLKDLGKKMFAFSKFDKGALEVLGKLNHE